MQQGSLIKVHRKRGPDVWLFPWAEKGPQGKRIYRKRLIGTVGMLALRASLTGCGRYQIDIVA